ncbi:PREDICTED: cytochrome P450 4C1-like isoform X1 [Trachymyrmex septentrionalis]|uniref:cytochrome P450 4C1-like isoform X1 n=1 Tax=Trachymyrmex septentrionalis TaxID=34720 RepID=UPI00084EF816|nr:PREDICTED: cytochrome P450 4C1-like isoform X1 [Trachymyrmex septentrionalis]
MQEGSVRGIRFMRMDFIFLALCTLCVVAIFSILSMIYHQYIIRQKLKNIPEVKEYPFIGLAFEFMKLSDYDRVKKFLLFMEEFKEGIFMYQIGTKPFIAIFKPEYLEHIFPSTVNITKSDIYNMLKPWLGNGLLTSTGKQWFHDRKLIGPTFHFSILDQFAVVVFEKAEILTKCLQKEIKKDPGKAINIFPYIINAALDIICETAMGVDVHAQEVATKYTSTVHLTSSLIMKRMLRPWLWIEWLFYSLPSGKQFKSALDILHGFTKEVISKRKIERQSQSGYTELENEDNELNIGKRKRQAFLDLLLDQNAKADTPLSDDELRAQVDTFMFEGHDTTAVAITWTLFLLGNNLEHQAKVHEELEEVFGDSETPASGKELSKLKYLDRVIKETLRIFPSVPIISRELTEDVKIDNYILPKGVMVSLSILLTHRNPAVWLDPLKFDPDRFLPENSKNRNPYAYVPFSAGPRNCIGQKFAQLEEKIVLTAILRKWRVKSVKTVDTIKFGGSLILRPSEDVLIHFTPKK